MLSITDNFLYVLDGDGCQQIFDPEKLKLALLEAFESAGNPNGYLAEDIACAVESAMAESSRYERIFTQSEVDAAVVRILENAGCAAVAQIFSRANSHLYIALDANVQDAAMLIIRHLGIADRTAYQLANKVVDALKKLHISSASPALYLELARHYEQSTAPHLPQPAAEKSPAPAGSKILLTAARALEYLPPEDRWMVDEKVIALANISRLYPNYRLTLSLDKAAGKLNLTAPITDLELAPLLYELGDKVGQWLHRIGWFLQTPAPLPLYLVLDDLDVFAEKYLGTTYPAGRVSALETASFFRNALDYPVKKVRCRTASGNN
ncbi:MAG: hypothetical protein E7052_05775 [Lentisphaerae bacterium]|nr:hypothetical protein [Lentisphaerota bacterium]